MNNKSFPLMLIWPSLTIVVLVAITGCDPTHKNISRKYELPEPLKNCSVYVMYDTRGRDITVVHCPNSNTTTQTGDKTSKTVTVVDRSPL